MPAVATEPAMLAAVDVQQHAGHGPALAAPPMRSALARFLHQPGALQQPLDAGVAVEGGVLLAQLRVEMPHAEVEIFFAIQTQHLFDNGERHALGAGQSAPAVQQPGKAVVLVTLDHAPQVARGVAQNPRCLPERDLLARGSQNDLFNFHRPLPGALRIAHHTGSPPAGCATSAPPYKADISCANYEDI